MVHIRKHKLVCICALHSFIPTPSLSPILIPFSSIFHRSPSHSSLSFSICFLFFSSFRPCFSPTHSTTHPWTGGLLGPAMWAPLDPGRPRTSSGRPDVHYPVTRHPWTCCGRPWQPIWLIPASSRLPHIHDAPADNPGGSSH